MINRHAINSLVNSINFTFASYANNKVVPVVAISGGVDSMVLAELFRKAATERDIPFKYRLVHFHHDQGRHDDECADAVYKYISEKSLESIFTFHRVDGSTLRSKAGFETIARKARYAFLSQQALNESEIGVIVTGHHANDQIENILMGICRGTPIDRVAMAKRTIFRNANTEIHRPLLDLSRKDIIYIANKFNLTWSEDDTNMDTKYERNFFRHSIIPLLNTKRNVLKSIPKSIPTPDTIIVEHENNLLSAEHNHFL